MVDCDRAVIRRTGRVCQAFTVIADGQDHLIGHKPLPGQLQRQRVRHLPRDEPRLFKRIRALQHLTGADAVRLGPVGLDVRKRARLAAPCVVDQQLRVHTEHPVQQLLVVKFIRPAERTAGDIAHREQALFLKLFRDPASDAPEIRQRPVRPERFAVAVLGKAGNAHAAFIRRHVFGPDIHGDLRQIQIRADPGGRGDAGRAQHVQNDRPRQLLRRLAVGAQIRRCVDEDLVDGIDVNVLRREIFEVDLIDLRGDTYIVRHLRRRGDEGERQLRVRGKRVRVFALAAQLSAWRVLPPHGVYLFDALHHLEQPRPARDAIRL